MWLYILKGASYEINSSLYKNDDKYITTMKGYLDRLLGKTKEQIFDSEHFTVSQSCSYKDYSLFVDSVSNRWCILDRFSPINIRNFSELTDYEIISKEQGHSSINFTSALIGEVLLGDIGALMLGKKTTVFLEDLELVLYLNDIKQPKISINLLVGTGCDLSGVKYNSNEYVQAKNFLGEILPLLSYIKTNTNSKKNNNTDIKTALIQIKELLDNGLITEEEYQNKRKEILSSL